MKNKILALALLCVTFFACSTEGSDTSANATPITKNTSGNPTIDGLYAAMINSPQHIAYKKAQTTFINKMNFTGTIADINTSAKLLTWISRNFSKTSFTNMGAAQNELNSVKNLYATSLSANMGLYNAIGAQAHPGQIWADLRATPYGIYNPCLCLGPYIYAMAGNAAVGAATQQISAGVPGALEAGFDAVNAWDAADAQALAAYNACLAACNN